MKPNPADSTVSVVRAAMAQPDRSRSPEEQRSLAVGLMDLQARLRTVRSWGGQFAGVETSEHVAALENAAQSGGTVAPPDHQRVEAHRLARDGETGRHFFILGKKTASRRIAS
ncbi:MAG: hypothetical protein HZA51_07295 [Planctomycetes bacterium]|nr:hypothetical protein [Planctomycetota bacterium]